MNKDAIPHHCLAADPHAHIRTIRDRFGASLESFFRLDHGYEWQEGVQSSDPVFSPQYDYKLVHPATSAKWISIGVHQNPDETDPDGIDAHVPGSKLDAGKPRAHLVLGDFSRALAAVVDVGTHGARKYTDHGWCSVRDGEGRYADAAMRHYLERCHGRDIDANSGLLHLAHQAWNVLAELELTLRNAEIPLDEDSNAQA